MFEYKKGHLQKNIKHWQGEKWYHQRFDGSPYFLHLIAEAEIAVDLAKKQGLDFDVHYCFFSAGKADWYIAMKDIKKVYTRFIQLGQGQLKFIDRIINAWKSAEIGFYAKCFEAGEKNLSSLADDDLIVYQKDFLAVVLRNNSCSSIIDGFALGTDELIAAAIRNVYDKSVLATRTRFSELFEILTSPAKISFINEAEVELLKMAEKIKNQPAAADKLLAAHQKKYFWIHNNYVDANILTVDYFAQEVKNILSSGIDIKKQINDITAGCGANKIKKEKLIKELKLTPELKFLLKTSEKFTHWQDRRKRSTFWSTHYNFLFLRELSRRTGIGAEYLKYASPWEFAPVLRGEISEKIFKERQKKSVFFWDKGGHECVSGEETEKIRDKILGHRDLGDVNDFRGLTAAVGVATGPVKIITSVKEINKINPGDILVAVMTRPDYLPAMKKAAAIVTDEGGITCHAAIVSRELKIPCVIGTKIATKVLKDGDRVQVNANHGVVKILR